MKQERQHDEIDLVKHRTERVRQRQLKPERDKLAEVRAEGFVSMKLQESPVRDDRSREDGG